MAIKVSSERNSGARLNGQRKDEKNMKQTFTASVWQEGVWFIAQCREIDVASQGETEEEALENLRDALELHFAASRSERF